MANRGGLVELLFGVGAVVLLPLLYGVAGFIVGVFWALIYNLAAAMIGGIRLEVGYHNLPYSTAAEDRGESPFIME